MITPAKSLARSPVRLAWLCLCLGVLSMLLAAADEGGVKTAASWIWYPENPAVEGAGQTRYLRRVVKLDQAPQAATLRVLADDSCRFFRVNGEPAPAPTESGLGGAVYDLSQVLRPGENVLAFAVRNDVGAGGLIVTGFVREVGGVAHQIRSDATFRAWREPVEGWDRPGFDASAWPAAGIVGNAFAQPWYRHWAFDLEPFIEPADRERWDAWRKPLLALPEGLAREPYAQAQIGAVNGSAALTINGVPRPALIYRGTVDPFTEHGRRQIGLFRDAGVHVYAAHFQLAACWLGPERYDFTAVDETLRAYLSADPQAYVILLPSLVPPGWWIDAHREELVRYAAGEGYNTSDESGRVARPSLASPIWRRETMAIWRAAIEHLEQQPWGKRVIGYHPCYGIYGEWHYYGSWQQQMPDTGPAMTAHFREWLRERYGDEAHLREAWGQPEATFAQATVPGVDARLAAGALGLRDPAAQRPVIDYYACQQAITADDLDLFCAAAKEITHGRVICGAFYGYFQGVPPQTQGGHLELERMLRSPHLDYFAAPYDYSHRLVGDDGRGRAIVDAFPLAGKVHMVEVDTRTHLHPLEEYGRVKNARESVAVIRREVATALAHGSAMWWCDFGADGSAGWYDDPTLIAEITRMMKLAEARLREPRAPTAQVAVICDLASCYSLADGGAMQTHYRLVDEVTSELYRTGTPFDTFLLSQLGAADLSRYRLLIFLNTLNVPPALRPVVAQATKGRTTLWLWAPGITDGRRFGPELVTALTGFRVALRGEGIMAGQVLCDTADPLTARLAPVTRATLTPRETMPIRELSLLASWYNPRDEKFMAEHYTAFHWEAANETLRWEFATTDGWTDLHLRAAVGECQGLSVEVAGEGAAVGAGLRVVIKDADAAEFVAPSVTVTAQPKTHVLALAGFVKAPWYQGAATRPRFPLTGAKFVVDGIGGGRRGTLVLKSLAAVRGDVKRSEGRVYGDPQATCPVLAIDDPQATPLGRDEGTGAVLLASKGRAGERSILSTVPFVPYPVLDALLDEAGVCRYIDSPQVIVRADSGLVSLHSAVGETYSLHLPRAAVVRNADTGQVVGRGKEVRVELPAASTTLLLLGPAK